MSALEDDGAVRRLVERARRGDSLEEDFRELFVRHYRTVLHLFRNYRFSEEEGRELTQETFLRVYKGIDKFGGEMRLASWIFQVARNIALNEIRSRKTSKRDAPEVPLEEPGSPDERGDVTRAHSLAGASPLEDVLVAERARLLREALAELPPQMSRCVLLRIEQDLKYREIATIMGISTDTVKAHLFQARQLLKARLADYFSGFEESW